MLASVSHFRIALETNRRANEGDAAALGHLIAFLRAKRVIPNARILRPTLLPAERCARNYEQYLRQDRALAKATIINYVPFITDFLKDRFGARPVRLSQLKAADVIRFVQAQARLLHGERVAMAH
jgi:hypothetical protein